MKHIAFSAVLALALSAPVLAQDQKAGSAPASTSEPKQTKGRMFASPEERAKRLQTQLSLTDEQTAKVQAVYEKNQEKYKALRDDKSLSEDDRRGKARELMRAGAEEVMPILTPEQKAKFKEELQKRRDKKA